jgi:Fic family protein
VDLFTPSVEAGVVAAEDLRAWRRSPVFIRDTLFVPPGTEKVPRMIDLLFQELAGIETSKGLLRAVLVHLWFVWIHPFPDGNGRTARFLMNAALLGGGLRWLTIRVDQRTEYFDALRRAQLREDYAPFARFIAGSLERSAGRSQAGQRLRR